MAVVVQAIQFWADWPNSRDSVFDVRAKSSKAWVSAENEVVPANESRVVGTGTITALRPTIPNITLPATSAGLDDQTSRWTVTLHRTGIKGATFTVVDDFPLPVSFEPSTTWSQIKINKSGKQPLRDTSVYTKTETNNQIATAVGLLNRAGLSSLGRVETATIPTDPAHPKAIEIGDPKVTADRAANVASIRTLGRGSLQAMPGDASAPPLVDSPLLQTLPCSGSSAGLVNKLLKLSGGVAVVTAITDTGGCIAVGLLPATGSVTAIIGGRAVIAVDAQPVSVGDYIVISNANAGCGKSAGATFPTSGQVVGRVVSSSAESTVIDFFGSEVRSIGTLQDVASRTKLTTGSLYDSYGDSITIGDQVGVTAPFRTLLVTRNTWVNTNHGVDGDQAADQSLVAVAKTITDADDQRFTLMVGYNDQRLYGSSMAKRGFFRRYAAATMAWLTIPNNRKLLGTDTVNMPETGSGWAADVVVGRRSGTAADTKSFTVIGRTIYIATLLHDSAGAGTATITIDGVSYGTMTSKATGATTLNGVAFAPGLYRFSGLDDTAHSVVITIDGTGFFYVEWVAGNSGLPFLHGPQLWVGTITRATSAGYISSGGSDVLVGQYNREIANAVAELGADGLPITLVNTNFLNLATDYIADGIHPNNAGHIKLANAFEGPMNGIADPVTRRIQSSVTIINAAPAEPVGLSDLNSLTQAGIYVKAGKLVVAYNNAGTLTFITIPLDGATATWTQTTTPP